MAAPSNNNVSTSSSKSDLDLDVELNPVKDEELDFFSANFNPERALFSDNIQVPHPEIKSFTGVSTYQEAVERRRLLKKKVESASPKTLESQTVEAKKLNPSKTVKSNSAETHRKTLTSLPTHPTVTTVTESVTDLGLQKNVTKKVEQTSLSTNSVKNLEEPRKSKERFKSPSIPSASSSESKVDSQRNVFTRMENFTGPLSMLTRCVQERLHVRVKTRGAVSVRSICRGYIVAFDKYFNMALIDVDEIYKRPVALGKIRARISHKLLAAKGTLEKERDEYATKYKLELSASNVDVAKASGSLQELRIIPDVKITDLHKILSTVSQKENEAQMQPSSQFTQPAKGGDSFTKLKECHSTIKNTQTTLKQTGSGVAVVVKDIDKKLRRIQSIYAELKAPLSPFEREALMLGVPDENVLIRHCNQMFVRGDNVVSVSIIDDF
ncbi:U7 snRNA-associated Sm-like protein LSm11 [Physella acuta]|uniref:U7 snRNA-associated Sm-like protein LSm11 n=1 Tax=Physella acuta TaxID=109671 RepID=UPI0027DBEE23|nr:U7 snRNA-associated Sm-like protein LSm11 [Physella acuta]